MIQAPPFVIHHSFADFFDQARRARPATLYLEHAALVYTEDGIRTRSTSYVVAGWYGSGLLHAVRLIVEDISLLRPNPSEIQEAVFQRAAAAADILAAYCTHHSVCCERGMVLTPGLSAELRHLDTSHQLWHLIYHVQSDPLTWQIQPGERSASITP